MLPGFSGAVVVGAPNSAIPVLVQVGLDDGTHYNFEYNPSGQVNVIRSYRSDNVQRAYTAFNYESPTADSPRLSATRVWAENWTGLYGVPAEVVTQYSMPGDGSCMMVAPDGTVFKEFYGTGWQKGLTTQSEIWSGGVRQKWTTTAWTQDNTGVNYQTNPRVTETNVYDSAGNRRRTTIDYGPYAQYGLANGVVEYAADGVTLLRVTFTDYNLSQAYLERHIIGLVSAVHVSDGAWQSKMVYSYDAAGDQLQATSAAATQHDAAYGTGFITGRGNVTAVSRYDASDISNDSKALTMRIGYDTDGSPLFTRDALNHQTSLSYADSFSDSNNSRNTFAYPSTLTDADSFSSTVQYNFDFGTKTRVQGPPPTGQSQGVIQTFTYDAAARVQQATTVNTGAYTRYVYGPNYVQSFSSVNNVADDAYAIQVFDGAGQVIGAAKNHPGSVGGYSLLVTIYDLMGRAVYRSNPTEINNSWIPVGDDAVGVFYTQQTYDWKGRPLVTTNTDATTKQASYGGCGCAGGEVVTLTDEVGRKQKVYSDVLGRTARSEVLNWDGSVYSAATNTYDARDQVTLARQYAGAEGSGTYQDTAMTYDGYGRLQTRHAPEQNAGTATVYSYNNDDTVYSVTDARGASATYSYNGRHQPTSINYAAPSGITPTPNVSFAYDAAGNRTNMTDGSGSVSYNYNELSRMTSETRNFNGLSGSYPITYDYNLAGELTNLGYFGSTASYSYDAVGRTKTVTGPPNLGISQYVSDVQYRASGSYKTVSYGHGVTLSLSYNSRLQLQRYNIQEAYQNQWYDTALVEHQYYADGRLRYAHDVLDERFDRAYGLDQIGRLTEAYSGFEARQYVNQPSSSAWGPYRQSYQYDALGDMTSRTSQFWSQSDSFTTTYVNGRNQDPVWQYDANGNVRFDKDFEYKYDAMGVNTNLRKLSDNQPITQTVDGDDQLVRRGEAPAATYYLRSSLLGGKVLTEFSGPGGSSKKYFYLDGEVLATLESGASYLYWRHENPMTGSRGQSNFSGTRGIYTPSVEPDSMGVNIGFQDPFDVPPEPPFEPDVASLYGGPGIESGRCRVEGVPFDCVWALRMLAGGIAARCPNDDCGPSFNPSRDGRGRGGWEVLVFDRNGLRYEPLGPSTKPTQTPGVAEAEMKTVDWATKQVEQNYEACKKELKGSPEPGKNQAVHILATSKLEGVNATLIAVTWAKEATDQETHLFDERPVANYRGDADGGWDVGPGQISTTYFNKPKFTKGLPQAFGDNFSESVEFNGDPFQNLRATARAYSMDILPRSSSLADAAGRFRAGRRIDPKTKKEDTRYRIRVDEFNSLKTGYDDFFDCLSNGPKQK